MKYIGAVLVFAIMTGLGIKLSLHLKRRTQLLESTVILLESMKMEFEYSMCPLDEIISKFASCEPYSSINFVTECYYAISRSVDFPKAWSDSVKNSSLYTSQEKGKLLQLGSVLGTSDCSGQVNILEMYTQYFKKFLQTSRIKSEKYSGVCVYIGIFCGLGMFVLLI